MSTKNIRTIALIILVLVSSLPAAPAARRQQTEPVASYFPVSRGDAQLERAELLTGSPTGSFIVEKTGKGTTCRDATPEEARYLSPRDPSRELHTITPIHQQGIGPEGTGLTIILRGTQQLESFPLAKNAFLRAAQTWQSFIHTAITVVIDVDYGPMRFGRPYPSATILGSTDSQDVGGSNLYPAVRSHLVSQGSSGPESQLDNALPAGTVPTDRGNTAAILAPSAVFRALGILDPVADPAGEQSKLGDPPGIGFNSSFLFDFDPSNGIDPNAIDFDAVATHEIGHALGFGSNVGFQELFPGEALAPTVLDLFRFRPGVTMASFGTAGRIQSSGGSQILFAGGPDLPLSTGRPDGSGGDGHQASHWKADDLLGQVLGIMVPEFGEGERYTITNNDLLAFDVMGYQVGAAGDGPGDGTNDTKSLTSGVPQQGSIDAPPQGTANLDLTQYTIQVPSDATQLTVDLNGNQDVDLFVRAGQRVTIGQSGPVADYKSESNTGVESVHITGSSSPPLRVATYYIAVANYGPGAANYSVRATITGGGSGGSGNNSPVITSLQGDLNGDVLTLTGVVADPDGDIAQAQSTLLDGSGNVVGQTNPFPVSFGSSTTVNFNLTISNLSAIPAAVQASLTFIDGRGNHSPARTADFSSGDSGGPTVSVASYNGTKLMIRGAGLDGQLRIEINGQVVAEGQSLSNKVKVKGSSDSLNLRSGANRLRVYNGTSRSNLFVFDS